MLRTTILAVATLSSLFAHSHLASAQILSQDLVFTSIVPCRIIDTRHATNGINHRLAVNVPQTFNVVGDAVTPTYFTGQGGLVANGCSIPGFSNGVAQVQAIVINLVAVSPAGTIGGFLVAWPTDRLEPAVSDLNYPPASAVANGIVLPVRQDKQGGDISVVALISATDLVADVQGYYSVASSGAGATVDTDCNGGSCDYRGIIASCPTSGGPTCATNQICACVCISGGGTANECIRLPP
jgi:hypothetical protein